MQSHSILYVLSNSRLRQSKLSIPMPMTTSFIALCSLSSVGTESNEVISLLRNICKYQHYNVCWRKCARQLPHSCSPQLLASLIRTVIICIQKQSANQILIRYANEMILIRSKLRRPTHCKILKGNQVRNIFWFTKP